MLRYKTDRIWFSRLLWHPARKQSGSILTTPESTQGTSVNKRVVKNLRQNCSRDSEISSTKHQHMYKLPSETVHDIKYTKQNKNVCLQCKTSQRQQYTYRHAVTGAWLTVSWDFPDYHPTCHCLTHHVTNTAECMSVTSNNNNSIYTLCHTQCVIYILS